MQKKWGSHFPEKDTLPWLLFPRRCFNFYSTLKEMDTISVFLKDCCLCSLALTLEPMQMETYEDATVFKRTCKGTLPHTLRASRPVVYEHTAVLYLCNKPEEFASAHTSYAEAEKGLRT